MKDTHETAIAPIGTAQRPKLNGPGTNLSLPDVIRRNMGAAYDVYRPITEDLREVKWTSVFSAPGQDLTVTSGHTLPKTPMRFPRSPKDRKLQSNQRRTTQR